MQCNLLEIFRKYVTDAIPVLLMRNEDLLASLLRTNATLVRKHRDVFLIFIGKNGSTQFIYKIKQMAKQNMSRLIAPHANKYAEYIVEFMVSVFLGVITYWLESETPLSYEELSLMLKTILLKGPVTVGTGLIDNQPVN